MVSIIILSYNTKDLLRKCLEAITTQLKTLQHEIIVLDNASKDESVTMVRKEFPSVVTIESDENLGFTKGMNRASKKAKGEYLLFLNSDALLLDKHISDMLDLLEKDMAVAAVGGNLLGGDGTTSDSYGRFYDLREVFRLLFLKTKTDRKTKTGEVDWVSGGFMLIRKAVFDEVQGFDEHYFMYIEDMDLCFRLKQRGYKVLYFPHALAEHLGQASSNRTFAVVHIFKGILYFYKKHRSLPEYFVVQLLLAMKAVSAYLFGLVSNNSYLRSTYSQALKTLL